MPATHYEVLGVSTDCCSEQIKKAFHLLARSKHPDKNLNSAQEDTTASFQQICSSYQVLKDTAKRRQYDEVLERQKTSNRKQLVTSRECQLQKRKACLTEQLVSLTPVRSKEKKNCFKISSNSSRKSISTSVLKYSFSGTKTRCKKFIQSEPQFDSIKKSHRFKDISKTTLKMESFENNYQTAQVIQNKENISMKKFQKARDQKIQQSKKRTVSKITHSNQITNTDSPLKKQYNTRTINTTTTFPISSIHSESTNTAAEVTIDDSLTLQLPGKNRCITHQKLYVIMKGYTMQQEKMIEQKLMVMRDVSIIGIHTTIDDAKSIAWNYFRDSVLSFATLQSQKLLENSIRKIIEKPFVSYLAQDHGHNHDITQPRYMLNQSSYLQSKRIHVNCSQTDTENHDTDADDYLCHNKSNADVSTLLSSLQSSMNKLHVWIQEYDPGLRLKLMQTTAE